MNHPVSARKSFIQIKTIYIALLAGQLIFLAVAYILVSNHLVWTKPGLDPLKYISMVSSVSALFASYFFKENFNKEASRQGNLGAKVEKYKIGSIISGAVIEGANIFNLIVYLLTKEYSPIILFVFLIIIFLLQFPSNTRIINDIKLTKSEQDEVMGRI
ncbi:hypothetical protein [Flexithrix dorotheae]|uniref:hypothetical protein n=1 Tax=Flexithrix dorotheae TaxID=70993 RepID=UPI00038012D8|nr:hypothetical protein [Flexithrix dorotheae]